MYTGNNNNVYLMYNIQTPSMGSTDKLIKYKKIPCQCASKVKIKI